MATNRKPNYNRNNKESTPRCSIHYYSNSIFLWYIYIYIRCSLKWISGQNDFKLVWFVFPFFKEHGNKSGTKEPTNQTSLKSSWPEIYFKLQHIRRWPVPDSLSVGTIEKPCERRLGSGSRSSLIALVSRPLFRSSPLTEGLEQPIYTYVMHVIMYARLYWPFITQ